jgi:hypothetical protein
MQPLSVIMSGTEDRELQRRLDVRVESSLVAARPLLLWAFQSSKKQLQTICGQRPSLLHATAAQRRAFGFHFGATQRQSLLTCSRLSVTLAVRFMCFRSECAVTHLLKRAACILSRRYELAVLRLGKVAAAGAGFVRHVAFAFDGEGNIAVFNVGDFRVQVYRLSVGARMRTIGTSGSGNGQFGSDCGVAFESEGNLVVDWDHHCVQVLRYRNGTHLRTIGSEGRCAGQFQNSSGVAFDVAGHIVVVDEGNHRVQMLRYSNNAHVRTIGTMLRQRTIQHSLWRQCHRQQRVHRRGRLPQPSRASF